VKEAIQAENCKFQAQQDARDQHNNSH